MSRPIKHGSTDQSVVVRILDSAAFTPETGVTSATSGLSLSYRREGGAVVAIGSLSDLAAADSAHSDGGLKHVSDGYYRLDVPDAAFASGSSGVLITGSATDMIVVAAYHPLVANVEADTYARLGAPAGASVAADVAAVKAETAAILEDTGTTLPATLSTIAGYVDTEVGAIVSAVGAVDAVVDAIKVVTDRLDTALEADGGSGYQFTETALENGPSGGGGSAPTAAEVADAVWDEALSEHIGPGTAGEALNASGAPPSASTIAAAVWAAGTRTLTAFSFSVTVNGYGSGQSPTEALAAYDPPTKAELDSGLAGLSIPTASAVATAVLTTQMAESYAVDGAAPTMTQALLACQQRLTEFAISGTTITVKRLDGGTTAMVLTLDDADAPTSSTRSS